MSYTLISKRGGGSFFIMKQSMKPRKFSHNTDQRIGHSTANYSRIMKFSGFVLKTIIFEKIKKDKL